MAYGRKRRKNGSDPEISLEKSRKRQLYRKLRGDTMILKRESEIKRKLLQGILQETDVCC